MSPGSAVAVIAAALVQARDQITGSGRGTPAAGFPGQVPLAVKKERLARLIEVTDGLSLDANRRQLGRTVEVLCEGVSKKNGERVMGRTRQNQPVVFPGGPELAGQVERVRIASVNTWTLEGEAV